MVCKEIKKDKRNYLGKQCSREEVENLRLIIIRIQCAAACLSPANIPDGCQADKARLFIAKAIEVKAEAQWLEENWWSRIIKQYGLPRGCFIDFDTGEFYTRKE